jgi:predicted kinase
MRKWMRERMKRRTKKTQNESESTGKVGQELPTLDPSQPAPLQPTYYDEGGSEEPEGHDPLAAEPGDVADKAEVEPLSQPYEPSRRGGYRSGRNQSEALREAVKEARGGEQSHEHGGEHRKVELQTQPDSPTAPPAGPEHAIKSQPPRAPRGVVVLAIGLPGSGKTTWFKRRGVTPLSSDLLRTLLFDDITEQRHQGLVFSALRSLLLVRLKARMPWNYVDATNLSSHERRQWIKMARSFGYEVQAVFFDVPIEVCIERNRKRERMVPEEVMRKMAERLREPTFNEGFTKIIKVRVKGAGSGTAALVPPAED